MSSADQDVATDRPGDVVVPRSRWALRHPRIWGVALLAMSSWLLVRLVDRLRSMALPGEYGQMHLSYEATDVTYYLVAIVATLVVLVVAAVMLFAGRPANRPAVIGILAGIILMLGLGMFSVRTAVFTGGEGCSDTYSIDELRSMWADRPTVGGLLTGGLLHGNVADDAALQSSIATDPSAAGCRYG